MSGDRVARKWQPNVKKSRKNLRRDEQKEKTQRPNLTERFSTTYYLFIYIYINTLVNDFNKNDLFFHFNNIVQLFFFLYSLLFFVISVVITIFLFSQSSRCSKSNINYIIMKQY